MKSRIQAGRSLDESFDATIRQQAGGEKHDEEGSCRYRCSCLVDYEMQGHWQTATVK